MIFTFHIGRNIRRTKNSYDPIIHLNVEDDDEFIVLNEYIEDDDRCVEDIVEGLPVELLTLLIIPS
jgi:hypothetical protein